MFRAAIVVALVSLIHVGPIKAQPPPRLDLYGDPLPAGAVARFGSSRLRQGRHVQALAFSPDDKRMASWSNSGLYIWDTSDSRELRHVSLTWVQLEAFRWLADGRGIAVFWCDPENLFVWEFTDEKAKLPPLKPSDNLKPPYDQRISAVAISPDGKWLAVGRRSKGSEPRPIEMVPLVTGKTLTQLGAQSIGEQPGYCTQLLFSPDSRAIFAFSRTQGPDRIEKSDIAGIPDYTVSGDFADSEHLVVRRVADGADLSSFEVPVVSKYFQHGSVAAIDSRQIAVGHADGKIRIWDCESKREVHAFAHRRGFFSVPGVDLVSLSGDGKTLISSGGAERELRRWDLETRKELEAIPSEDLLFPPIAFSNDNRLIAGGSGPIRFWKWTSGEPFLSTSGHASGIDAIYVDPDGLTALTASSDRTIRSWELNSGMQRRVTRSPLNWVSGSSVFSDDGKELILKQAKSSVDGRERFVNVGCDSSPATRLV